MTSTRERIPNHLRRYVVEHDYSAYNEIDQAVWRFILLQTSARLLESAHPAYADGLTQTGISPDHIPHIDDMDRRLSDFGWGAVAVDGFLPPRAFQEFQALEILTIAADIRSPDHLAYTPAPDIVHESAGHAPIIPDPDYRGYLRRFGEVGSRAFSSPWDRRLDLAVRRVSAIKEDASASREALTCATRDLADAENARVFDSEAAILSRLHWWTVEYGLVGMPNDYRLFGAGLLSSLGESHFCHTSSVEKRRLSAACTAVKYDITKPQPQLFVAESFSHLSSVLSEVASTFSQNVGGAVGLKRARESDEVATLELSTGLQIIGQLGDYVGHAEEPAYLRFVGPCALSVGGKILDLHDPMTHPDGFGTPIGRLRDAEVLSHSTEADLRRFTTPAGPGRLKIEFASGVVVTGLLLRTVCRHDGRLLVVSFSDCRVQHRGELLFDPSLGTFDLAIGETIRSAFAGPADSTYWPQTAFSEKRCPNSGMCRNNDQGLLSLYRESLALWENPDAPTLRKDFESILESIRRDHRADWLLRWNLLECLEKTGQGGSLVAKIRKDLLEVEREHPRDLPVAMGLRFLQGPSGDNGHDI